MFGKNRKYKKAANAIGPYIHQQIVKAMEARQDVFSNPEEIAFVAGYLYSLMWNTLDKRGCKDADVQTAMLKHVCDGVIPGRLWDVVERGQALGSSFFGDSKPEYTSPREAYELGTGCGIYDATEFDDAGTAPENLRRYIVDKLVKNIYS